MAHSGTYEPPTLTTWGSVASVTSGHGGTTFTDGFLCQAGKSENSEMLEGSVNADKCWN